jgi:hypothetical protein
MVVFTNDKDNCKFGSIYETSHTYTGLFVTDDRRAKCIFQNASVLCMYVRISLTVWKEVAYSSHSYTHFQKPLVPILRIYLGFYRRCFWFESLLSYWLSMLEMFTVLQCSGVKT